jgi:CheY-like chemotaxis protein
MILNLNGYDVVTAVNGIDALAKLSETEIPFDLIISDIMMPGMSGYQLFTEVSENPDWGLIPFLFLSARTSPKEIQLGKMLGIDDYLTKPINESDLIASITGKLARKSKIDIIGKQIEDRILSTLKIDVHPSLSEKDREFVSFLYMIWDEEAGPKLRDYYPKNSKKLVEKIGIQLFSSTTIIFGSEWLSQFESEGILLNIKNIRQYGYLFFDNQKDNNLKKGLQPFMLAVLAPKINYLEVLGIKKIFQNISAKINMTTNWDIEESWNKISKLLSSTCNDQNSYV